jgi:putative FmdB family regulatory protein
MPTYEYACKSCGEHLEVVQSFKDDPLTECAACGGPLRKVFGSIGIAFKGSGFYKTDSRSSTSSSDGSSSKSDSSGSGREAASGSSSEGSSSTGSSGSASSGSSSEPGSSSKPSPGTAAAAS